NDIYASLGRDQLLVGAKPASVAELRRDDEPHAVLSRRRHCPAAGVEAAERSEAGVARDPGHSTACARKFWSRSGVDLAALNLLQVLRHPDQPVRMNSK